MNPANQGQLRLIICHDIYFADWQLDEQQTVTVHHPLFGTRSGPLDGLPACRRAEALFRSMLPGEVQRDELRAA